MSSLKAALQAANDGTEPIPPELIGGPFLTTGNGTNGSRTLRQSYSRFSQISLIWTLVTTLSGLPTLSTDPRALLEQATHVQNTQDEMDPLDAVLALLVHNMEVLAGMAHIHPSKATVSLEQSDAQEENQEKDFTCLSMVPNPRRRKEVNVRVKVTKVEKKIRQKAKEKVEDGKEKKGEAQEDNDMKEDEEGGKKKGGEKEGKGKEGENKEGGEDRVSKLVMRQNLKALKKGEKEKKKEKMAEAEQKQNMMQKDGYTLLEPGLNAWVAINNMDQDEVWEEIFPAVQ